MPDPRPAPGRRPASICRAGLPASREALRRTAEALAEAGWTRLARAARVLCARHVMSALLRLHTFAALLGSARMTFRMKTHAIGRPDIRRVPPRATSL